MSGVGYKRPEGRDLRYRLPRKQEIAEDGTDLLVSIVQDRDKAAGGYDGGESRGRPSHTVRDEAPARCPLI